MGWFSKTTVRHSGGSRKTVYVMSKRGRVLSQHRANAKELEQLARRERANGNTVTGW